MKKNYIFLVCLFLTTASAIHAQIYTEKKIEAKSRRSYYTTGLGGYFGGPNLVGMIYLDHCIGSKLVLELSGMNVASGYTIRSVMGGIKYLFFGDSITSGWSPYIGLSFYWNHYESKEHVSLKPVRSNNISIYKYEDVTVIDRNYGLYIPVGMEFQSETGILFSVEVAYKFANSNDTIKAKASDGSEESVDFLTYSKKSRVWGGMKIGRRF